jgi:hypothetical protein
VDIGTLIDDNYRFEFKKLVPQLSPSFISWLEKMVAPNVKQRFDNAAVALEALKPIRVVGGATWQEILGYAIKPKMSAPVVWLAVFGIFAIMEAQTRDQTKNIQLQFNGEPGERFSIKVIFGDVSVKEDFVI